MEIIVFYQALQVVERDPLYVEAMPWQHKLDVPKAETILAGEHLIWNGLIALDEFKEVFKFYLGHLQKRSGILMWIQIHGLEIEDGRRNVEVTYLYNHR